MSKRKSEVKKRFTAVVCSKITNAWSSSAIWAMNLEDAERKTKKLYPEDKFWIGDVHEGL